MKRGIVFIVVSLSCLFLLTGCGKQAKEKKATAATQEFAFDFEDVNGKEHKLADFHGEKLVVKYWASWCSICLAGLDEVEEIASDQTKEYQFITIVAPSYKNEKKAADFSKWFETLELTNMTVLLDEEGELASKIGIRAYPTYVYYDSAGEVAKVVPGHADRETIEATLAEI